jgi:hypothetical protein
MAVPRVGNRSVPSEASPCRTARLSCCYLRPLLKSEKGSAGVSKSPTKGLYSCSPYVPGPPKIDLRVCVEMFCAACMYVGCTDGDDDDVFLSRLMDGSVGRHEALSTKEKTVQDVFYKIMQPYGWCSEVGRIDRRTCLPDAVDLVGERGSDGGLTDCTDCYTYTVRLYCCTDLC